jgi:hypothetical protein
MGKYVTTHMPAEKIDELRLKAFRTNIYADKMDYYKAASLYFQERHERAMNRADLPPTPAEAMRCPEVQALVEALDGLTLVLGLTAFKHENQRKVLQDAHDQARAALAAMKEVKK